MLKISKCGYKNWIVVLTVKVIKIKALEDKN
jgi:hypothetical protein